MSKRTRTESRIENEKENFTEPCEKRRLVEKGNVVKGNKLNFAFEEVKFLLTPKSTPLIRTKLQITEDDLAAPSLSKSSRNKYKTKLKGHIFDHDNPLEMYFSDSNKEDCQNFKTESNDSSSSDEYVPDLGLRTKHRNISSKTSIDKKIWKKFNDFLEDKPKKTKAIHTHIEGEPIEQDIDDKHDESNDQSPIYSDADDKSSDGNLTDEYVSLSGKLD